MAKGSFFAKKKKDVRITFDYIAPAPSSKLYYVDLCTDMDASGETIQSYVVNQCNAEVITAPRFTRIYDMKVSVEVEAVISQIREKSPRGGYNVILVCHGQDKTTRFFFLEFLALLFSQFCFVF